jgi:large subunit ribosomal protein L28
MSRVCQITGKKAMVGNHVSHSTRRTKRKFNPNLFDKKFYIPEENRWVKMRVSAAGIRIINRLGVHAAMKQAKEKGFLTIK